MKKLFGGYATAISTENGLTNIRPIVLSQEPGTASSPQTAALALAKIQFYPNPDFTQQEVALQPVTSNDLLLALFGTRSRDLAVLHVSERLRAKLYGEGKVMPDRTAADFNEAAADLVDWIIQS